MHDRFTHARFREREDTLKKPTHYKTHGHTGIDKAHTHGLEREGTHTQETHTVTPLTHTVLREGRTHYNTQHDSHIHQAHIHDTHHAHSTHGIHWEMNTYTQDQLISLFSLSGTTPRF